MHLFIDTNIFLSFYSLSSDDLNELHKLKVLINKKKIKLYFTEQVRDEITRNRDNKIRESLKQFRDTKFTIPFPAYCKNYDEYEELKSQIKSVEILRKNLVEKIESDVFGEKLQADNLILEISEASEIIERTEHVTARAKIRSDLGNPPGKSGSIGDAVNWELLLEHIPNHNDLYIVCKDSDFASSLDKTIIDQFLQKEWSDKKKRKVFFYQNLSRFFQKHFPDIEISEDPEKEEYISMFVESPNFATTHAAVAVLSKYESFTHKQTTRMLTAAESNSQIFWIYDDDDVKEFIEKLEFLADL